MSVESGQIKPGQVAPRGAQSRGARDVAESAATDPQRAPLAQEQVAASTALSTPASEGVVKQSTTQGATELADIANEVRRIRISQQRSVEVGSTERAATPTQRRSNRPGDADVIVGATKNDALPVSDRAQFKEESKVFDLENKLAVEPERVASDFGATIREMQSIRRQPLSYYEPAPSDARRLGEAVKIEMDTRRKVEITELIEKRGNEFGGGLVNMNPTIAYQEIVKTSTDYNTSMSEASEYAQRLPAEAEDAKPGTTNSGAKVAGSLERYAAAAQFAEKTQSDVGTKSLEQIKEALRSRGALEKLKGSK